MKLLILVNVDWFFISHRLPIAIAAKKYGYDVHIATKITKYYDELLSYGFVVHPLPIKRSSTNFVTEIKTFIEILFLLKRIKPDILHTVTIKPTIYGGIAARIASVSNVVVAISGLGYLFVEKSTSAFIRRFLVSIAYKIALKHKNIKVIFQNSSDVLILKKIAKLRESAIVIISGSGVDLEKFSYSPPRNNKIIVLMAARLLKQKGVYEYISAAKVIRQRGYDAIFQLAGTPDHSNPGSVSESEYCDWKREGLVEILGYRSDMHLLLSQAHIFVLPSFYGEGLSKALVEAAACGRPVITTNIPGCIDAIVPNMTGLIVPPKDSIALANAIERLINDKKLCEKMGAAGRKLAEQRYSIESIVNLHLEIYYQLSRLIK